MTRLGLWLGAALLAASGCAGPAADSIAQPAPTVGAPEQAVDLPALAGSADACLAEAPVHLPVDATPTSALVCTTEVAPVAGDGEWMFTVTRRVTDGLPRLLQAYQTPDEDRTNGPCRSDLPDPRVVWLEIGEATVPVRAPYDECAKPIPTATQAYDALVTIVEKRQPIRRVTSQLALDTGCAQEWKDVLAIEADLRRPVPTAAPTPLPAPVRACIYEVVGDGAGRLTAGRTLSPDEQDAVNAALAQARADSDCRRDGHHRFAVLLPADQSEPTYVALDGCAVAQGSAWWQASDTLRHALS